MIPITKLKSEHRTEDFKFKEGKRSMKKKWKKKRKRKMSSQIAKANNLTKTTILFNLKHISRLKIIENLNDVSPSMVMASPSGLQSGLSR